ncbi:PKD domain-containing protein [Natrarchaeobius halalkaliphilus]|uniref:PKD domain-containing protein n=1 Tax=Natrarchaeobius halalkaliphilus TaxID=1679091 RepID=A0A3N6M3J3_9EURY|nr:PKD domain-containing protein [Natrarchaeobius halalkaliphilus]RQG86677.1 PKD domain-containing protein [Natrarchaeobius halalkaliphilus]
MKRTRRNVLRDASKLSALLAGLGAAGAAKADSDEYPEWDSETVYTGDDRVVYDGSVWEASWWTQGDEPGESEWGPWEEVDDSGDPDPEPPDGPTATVSTDPLSPEPGDEVEFDAADSDGEIEDYGWEFGDGETATGENVTHAYGEEGEYTVELTVIDDGGQTDSETVTVSVEPEDESPPVDPGEIPDQVFAPYHHLTTDPETTPVEWSGPAGTDYFHLAFILGTGDGTPAWDGDVDHVVGESQFDDEIRELQDQGGQAIISFGGAVGNYLASDYDDPTELADTLEFIVDEYDCPYLDIDDEAPDMDVVDLRNEAIAILQDRRPDVHVGYTVRTRVDGVADTEIITNAIDNGVDVGYVNLMTMNWGWVRTSAENCIECAEGTHDQLQEWLPEKSDEELYTMIGITPMIGVQNSGGPFYPEDAAEVRSYAEDHDLGLLSFWSIERDNPGDGLDAEHSGIEQDPFDFSENVSPFTAE